MDNQTKKFNDLVQRMKDLPSLPATVVAILKVLDNPRSTARDLSEALHHDQSLAARILRIVNSAYYGFPREIDTLSKAVTILGYTSIRNLILVTKTFDVMRAGSKERSLNWKQLWRHALACGVAAQTMAIRLRTGLGEEVLLAGLLHDIGKVILDTHLHQEYSEIIRQARERELLLVEAEKEMLGVTHADFGRWLADAWNLPHNLTEAITHHHDPTQSKTFFVCASLVHMGDILARALELGGGGDDQIPAIDPQAWSALGLTPALLADLLEDFEERYDKAQAFLPEEDVG